MLRCWTEGGTRLAADEDADAPRRLYYVAMTRARKTLTLARVHDSPNDLLGFLRGVASVIRARTGISSLLNLGATTSCIDRSACGMCS